MEPADIQIGNVYRNEQARFDVRAILNPGALGQPGYRFIIQTRPSRKRAWAPAVFTSNSAERTRERVVTYLNGLRDPSTPA